MAACPEGAIGLDYQVDLSVCKSHRLCVKKCDVAWGINFARNLLEHTDESKAKAAEAAAKTARGNKGEAFTLCKSMDKSAAHCFKASAAAKKGVKPAAPKKP